MLVCTIGNFIETFVAGMFVCAIIVVGLIAYAAGRGRSYGRRKG